MNNSTRLLAVFILACVPLSAIAAEKIQRDEFFQRCEQIVQSQRSFQALDRNKMGTFRLDPPLLDKRARQEIGYMFDEIESVPGRADDLRQVAYVIGTAYRESEGTMRSTSKEKLWCLTEQRCKELDKPFREYSRIDPVTQKNYVGRGYAQLTGKENYLKFGELLSLNPPTALYTNPELALEPKTAARILTIGMYKGKFTHYKLGDFFSPEKEDWINARKIVNPKSPRAEVTAGYGMLFYECLGGTPIPPKDTKGRLIWPGAGAATPTTADRQSGALPES